jgi:uncharacterized protein YhbP (UPF0306 family)
MFDMTRETVLAFLAEQSTLVLSTVNEHGVAQSAPLFYLLAEQPGMLCWLSSPDSDHSINISRNAQCSAAVFRATDDWTRIAGVQMTGYAAAVSAEEREPILARYCERFSLDETLSAVISKSTLYAFRPAWIRYIDNSRGFGWKLELSGLSA